MLHSRLSCQSRFHAPRWLPAPCVPRVAVKRIGGPQHRLLNVSTTFIACAASEAGPVEIDTAAPEAPSSSSNGNSSSSGGSSSPVPAPAENILYATSLASATTAAPTVDALKAHVKECTGVQEVLLIENRTPAGRVKHIGYVMFDSPDNADAARQKLNGSKFNGCIIKVKTHRREPNPQNAEVTQVGSIPTTGGSSSGSRRKRSNPYAQANYVRVNNLAWSTMNEDLSEHVKSCEGVQDVFVTQNSDGRPSGVGYVRFETETAAAAAVKALQGSTLDGRELRLRQMKPAPVETAPAVSSKAVSTTAEAAKPSAAALKGASETETRIVVKQLPPSFTWREVFGMCSLFGEVRRVQMVDMAKNKTSEAAAVAEDSGGESSEGKQKRKLIPAAVVFLSSREAAEKALAALNGLEVQGSKLRANIYRGYREKAQSIPAEAVADANHDADAHESSGSE